MEILHAGGAHLAWRERCWWAAVAALATVSAATPILVPHLPAVLSILAALALGASESTRRLVRIRKGRRGERLVTDLLRSLPDDYHLVNDVTLGRRGNIDHVLIGPCGVVVIETKHVAGKIRCYRDGWYVNGRLVRSFSKQVNAGAAAIREVLQDWYPDQRHSTLRYVESLVVFTNALCQLDVNRPSTCVVRYSELLELIHNLHAKHRMPAAIASRLARTLALGSVRDGAPRASAATAPSPQA